MHHYCLLIVFRTNTKRLTTPFDIYPTLKSVLDFPSTKGLPLGHGDVRNRSISLFTEVTYSSMLCLNVYWHYFWAGATGKDMWGCWDWASLVCMSGMARAQTWRGSLGTASSRGPRRLHQQGDWVRTCSVCSAASLTSSLVRPLPASHWIAPVS